MTSPSTTTTRTSTTSAAAMRKPSELTRLDRCRSEKTVDTEASVSCRFGESRSSVYSRNSSSRLSLLNGSSCRSLSSKSIVVTSSRQQQQQLQGSDRSLRSSQRTLASSDVTQQPHSYQSPSTTQAIPTTLDRRVRKLGYSDEEKQLMESQSPKPEPSVRRSSRMLRMLSWVGSGRSIAQAAAANAEKEQRTSRSDSGLSLILSPAAEATLPKKGRSRSAVFVKTSNGSSEGILYR